MLKHCLSLALPGVAIIAAALAQLALVTLWPGVQRLHFPIVSADSYFVVLLAGALCFVAGRWSRRSLGNLTGLICALAAPLAFLGLFLWPTLGLDIRAVGFAHIAWLTPITSFLIVSASLPLAGVALGWAFEAPGR
jgi:hypothetical protein